MSAAAERQYAKDAKALERSAFQRLSSTSRRLLAQAGSQARARDDDHGFIQCLKERVVFPGEPSTGEMSGAITLVGSGTLAAIEETPVYKLISQVLRRDH